MEEVNEGEKEVSEVDEREVYEKEKDSFFEELEKKVDQLFLGE